MKVKSRINKKMKLKKQTSIEEEETGKNKWKENGKVKLESWRREKGRQRVREDKSKGEVEKEKSRRDIRVTCRRAA